MPPWGMPSLLALAVVLGMAAAWLAGALWARQRQHTHLHAARQQARLLAQLLGQATAVWCWQTDARHHLVGLHPPPGAPASAWEGAAGTDSLWQRFDDDQHSLQARMQAHVPLQALPVRHAVATSGSGAAAASSQAGVGGQPWCLHGLPRLDAQGQFDGYTGVAWPTDTDHQAGIARQALDTLLDHGPAVLCLAVRDAAAGWRLQRASPAARQLLGLPAAALAGQDGAGPPWHQALGGLPEALRQQVLALQPGGTAEADGWLARLQQLGGSDDSTTAPCLLLALAPTDGGRDGAVQALAAEHAAFSYTISHDLRAPIRVVEGFSRILKEDYGTALDRVGRDHVDRVLAAAARMNHMIDALLSLGKLSTQPLQRQPVDLSRLAGFVIDDLRRAQPERQVSVHIAPGMVAQGDPTLLRMALENLLGNAWKYSAKVPQAVLRFEPEVQEGRPGYVVSDNGAGFDMRFADRLFGVFQRLHSSSDFQGTGVGLASVQRIVRRHGGDIWAESEVGQGARFHFRLKDG